MGVILRTVVQLRVERIVSGHWNTKRPGFDALEVEDENVGSIRVVSERRCTWRRHVHVDGAAVFQNGVGNDVIDESLDDVVLVLGKVLKVEDGTVLFVQADNRRQNAIDDFMIARFDFVTINAGMMQQVELIMTARRWKCSHNRGMQVMGDILRHKSANDVGTILTAAKLQWLAADKVGIALEEDNGTFHFYSGVNDM